MLEKSAITEVTDRNIFQTGHPNLIFFLIYYYYYYFLIVRKFEYLYNCVMMKL